MRPKTSFFVEALLDIGFHTVSLMNSTDPSTIWYKSSASYAHALAKYSMSALIGTEGGLSNVDGYYWMSLNILQYSHCKQVRQFINDG